VSGTVVIVGTCDTKGPEIAYLRDRLQDLDLRVTVVDAGILGEPLAITPDVPADEVARHGGDTLEGMRAAGSRGRAVERMRRALRSLVGDLHARGDLDAIVGLGGAEGAVMSASAMMVLPLGVPKVLLSPIASGHHYFGPLVGTKDVMVVHTVVDILGLNPVATTVFDNVAAAVAGLVAHGHALPPPDPSARYVAVTMLGNTTTAVMALRDRLADDGYEAVVFHSNGVGGPAMEELAASGQFVGVVDFTTNEVTDPLVGGIHDGGPDRLRRIGELGLPQVVVPGCIDFSVFHTGTVPDALADRPVYDHNPEFTLVRTPADEMRTIGGVFAERLGAATGPLHVVVPTRGLSIPNTPDGPFWDPPADAAFLEALRAGLADDVPVTTLPHHVNEPDFGRRVAEVFVEMMTEKEPQP
jgi:uncharacterized protein (UPF0261 family)